MCIRDSAALSLFLDRMRSMGQEQDLTLAEMRTASRICRGVEGVPLAVELAAGGAPAGDEQRRRGGGVFVVVAFGAGGGRGVVPVSYTHLDVYKRQSGRRRLMA